MENDTPYLKQPPRGWRGLGISDIVYKTTICYWTAILYGCSIMHEAMIIYQIYIYSF